MGMENFRSKTLLNISFLQKKTVAMLEIDLIECFSFLENYIIDRIKHVMYVSKAALAKLAKSRINGFQVF